MPTGDLFAQTKDPSSEEPVLAHCDGGARGNPGPAGYGAVVTTTDGTILAELSEFLGFRTNNYAEYAGLLGVLQWCLDNGYLRLRVVSDSLLMVNQVAGRYKVNSPDLKLLHEEARRRIARLESFQIAHALRHKNKAADRLANEAMDRGTNRAPAVGAAAPAPLRATPYPTRSAEPKQPAKIDPKDTAPAPQADMLRGFVREGTIHLLGSRTLPNGTFVKILPE